MRSPVPDLIYPEYRLDRIEEALAHLRYRRDSLPERWRRLTLFCTYRCNLRCVYCKTTRVNQQQAYPAKDREFDTARFARLLAALSDRPLQHVHFTGGEATIVPDLPHMVAMANRLGVLCSTTSNGMAKAEVYELLVDAGLSEIRISLDCHDPNEFNRIVRRPGAYRQVIDNVKRLARLRDQNRGRPFLILNMCVGRGTRRRLAEFVRTSLDLGPDDIKLIPVVQARNGLGDFPEKDEVAGAIEDLLAPFPFDAFPLLRYKLQGVFAPESLGLKDLASRQLMKHCFIPLTERTLDTTYYYPCSVYLREGGKPLGRIDEDDLETQQRKIAAFVAGQDCIDDLICREYCISCCKRFNLAANAAVRGAVWDADGREQPLVGEVTVAADVSTARVSKLKEEIEHCRRLAAGVRDQAPFLVIKPSGLSFRGAILEELEREGLAVVEERRIIEWNRCASAIYCDPHTDTNLRRSLILAEALPGIEGGTEASMLILHRDSSMEALQRVKRNLRTRLIPQHILIRHEDELIVSVLNQVHVPDPERLEIEYALLTAAMGGALCC